MRKQGWIVLLFVLAGLAGCIGADTATDSDGDGFSDDEEREHGTDPEDPQSRPFLRLESSGADDVVVVAVIDWQINPYHWDYLAAHMPQHRDEDPSNDLPLDRAPHEWIPGFPDPDEAFDSYEGLDLSLTPEDPGAVPQELHDGDAEEWEKVEDSDGEQVHFRYIPGTKVVGFLDFDGGDGDGFAPSSHGTGASSVSVGNYHGTCPNCVLVFVNIPTQAAEEWVAAQDWIDVSTHSYEGSRLGTGVTRDNIADCDMGYAREAVERGQQIFWAAGNGLANTFNAPQVNLVNCAKAADWTVAVGAIHPSNDGSYTGHGKPVHVSNVGSGYASAGGDSVADEGSFGGTSNATPVTTGLYAEALHRLRTMMAGPSRVQENGTVSAGGGVSCGDANPDCPVADGVVTGHELRQSLFRAAAHTTAGMTTGTQGLTIPFSSTESEYLSEGHGSFHGTNGDRAEIDAQAIVDEAIGATFDEPSPELHGWMVAYSWCVQQAWGTWDHGYWTPEVPLPAPDPEWPFRSWMASEACPAFIEAANSG